jgi:predicted nucleotide-binding protein (sugar kinase/HSP70/actin superfamily)
MELFDRGVQYVLLPNVLDGECHVDKSESMLCPWNQTLPFVLRSAPRFEEYSSRLLMPTVHFKVGQEFVRKELVAWGKGIGLSRSACGRAVDRAYESQRQFQSQLLEAGSTALELLDKAGELGIVVVGRSYNIYDKSINLNIPSKLRDYYSVNVIPIDFLPVEQQSVADINDNMFWQSGRRILAAAKIVGQHANLHIVYITNFKCGPDSFIKHFITAASGRPFLSLQFDGHGNDAGFLTRCEAYLDSKGFLRSWMHDELIAHRRAAEQPGIGEQRLGIRETGRSL